MKAKLTLLTLVGLTTSSLVFAQDAPAPAAGETTPPAVEAATNTPAATPVAVEPVAAAVAPVEPAAVPDAPPSPTLAPATPANIIPLIQFQDVPLTTAIDNLARQASINYILDPKVGYGQPDERGQIKTQPNISIRWENLTAEQALHALITTYGLQLVTDSKTGIARVTVKDPAAAEPLVTKVIQLKFASPSNTVSAVQAVLTDKRSKVIADVRTSQLVISATEKEQEAVEKLIERLDTQTKQVLIEAKILETTLSPKTSKGIDWSGTVGAQNVAFGNNVRQPPATESLGQPLVSSPIPKMLMTGGSFDPSTAFLDADGVAATISFLNTSGDTKVVSEPRMVTLDNQKATIDVGLMYPVVNVQASTANTTGGSQISYTNLTINLDVTPRIAANNYIELRVQQGILRLGPTFASTVAGQNNVVDSFLTRKLDTTVLIPSGNTLVMGGLIQDENRTGNTKVPLLGDIPGIGLLFRKDTKELDRQNLTIFITPTVVEDSDFQPKKSTFLQSTGSESVTEDWSWWDSGKPASEVAKDKEKNQHQFN
jgi:type II secretory pathway component GspD/PulD (secretin)